MKSKSRVFIFALFLVSFLFVTFFLGVNEKESQLKYLSNVWKHRGGVPENTIIGVKRSLSSGYKGVEVDIQYHEGSFYLSHDDKKSFADSDNLRKLFEETKYEKYNVWLDFKNLSIFNANAACGKLRKILEKFSRIETSLVESKKFYPLFLCRRQMLNVSYWISVDPSSSIADLKYKVIYFVQKLFKFKVLSTDIRLLDKIPKKILKGSDLHLFTIKSENEKTKFLKKRNVKVILDGIKKD